MRVQSLMSIGDDPELADEALELDDTILYRLTAVQEMVQDEIKCTSRLLVLLYFPK